MKLNIQGSKLLGWFQKYKLVLLVLAAGVVLLLWPTGKGDAAAASPGQGGSAAASDFDLEALERKLERVLSQIDGAGEVSVALTVRSGVEQIYAVDGSMSQDESGREEETRTVIVSTGSGTEEAVPVQQRYPAFRGAVVVCPGGGDPEIRLLITQAVSALTGLGTDRITVCRGK